MPSYKQEIFLIRHGETVAASNTIIGQTEIELSSAGKKCLTRLKNSWKQALPAKLYCSDSSHARQSAALLNKTWQLPISPDDLLKEQHFGLWETKTWDEAYAADPEFFDYWAENWHTEPAPMGESFADMTDRCRDWLSQVNTEDSPVVVVAHAGSIRAITSILLDLPGASMFNFDFTHASVSKFEVSDESSRVIYLNNNRFH